MELLSSVYVHTGCSERVSWSGKNNTLPNSSKPNLYFALDNKSLKNVIQVSSMAATKLVCRTSPFVVSWIGARKFSLTNRNAIFKIFSPLRIEYPKGG